MSRSFARRERHGDGVVHLLAVQVSCEYERWGTVRKTHMWRGFAVAQVVAVKCQHHFIGTHRPKKIIPTKVEPTPNRHAQEVLQRQAVYIDERDRLNS